MNTTSACPKCGHALEEGMRFCASCGQNVTRGHTRPSAPTQVTATDLSATLLQMLRNATLGEFEILEEIGRGGMATVYLAHDIALNRKVAIKVMSPAVGLDTSMVERFTREAQTAASLSHPNIIPVYTVRSSPQLTYFVMKFVVGRPLDSIMEELGPMPVPMVTAILMQVAGALGYGHKRGVVHRDVKPGNIMIDDEGWAMVTDFGIAKVEAAEGLTQTGAAIGTPTYMSPEQCTAKEVGGRSDQYSLGVVGYEMLTGKRPFEGDSVMSVMFGHVNEPPPPFRDQRPDCPDALYQTLMRMLEKKPDDRFATMEHVMSAIGGAPLKHDDPVRTKMITLASEGLSAKLVERVRTPRSPVPLHTPDRTPARQGTPAAAPATPAPVQPPPTVVESDAALSTAGAVAGAAKKRSWVGITLTAVILAGGTAAGYIILTDGAVSPPPPVEQPVQPPVSGPATPAVDRVTIGISDEPLFVGDVVSLTASVTDAAGATLDRPVRWTSSDPTVASIDGQARLTALAEGSTVLTATVESRSTQTTVRVRRPPPPPTTPVAVASVSLSQSAATLDLGEQLQLSATPRDASGNRIPGQPVSWSSSDPGIATVANGVVDARGPGTARITATSQGRTMTADITVRPEAVASVTVTPPSTTLQVGESVRLRALARGSRGSSLDDRPVTWATSDPAIVAVAADGTVQGVGAGRAVLTANVGGVEGTASIVVESVATPPPTTGPTPAESRAQITSLVDAYARALESRDLAQVRQAHPGLTPMEVQQWRDFFDLVRDLTVDLTITNISIDGNAATAVIQGRYDYRLRRGGSDTQRPNFRASFVLDGNVWRMTSINGQ